jgi:cytidylate kinase
MIITIDGPAASGKGTVAKGIAERLGFEYLDTGSMYRAVALAALQRGIACDDSAGIAALLPELTLEMPPGRVILNGEDITGQIRRPDISQEASKAAAIPAVRSFLIPQQRQIAAGRNFVCEGRDQGTVVFPDAPVKFFVTADVRTRAERRCRELRERGLETTLEREIAELKERDRRDMEREVGPLREPPDAIHVDTTQLTPDEVLDVLEREIRKCLPART